MSRAGESGSGGQAVSFDLSRKRNLLCFGPFFILVFSLQAPTQLNAQTTGQSLSGRITSTSGAPIANARVTVKNPASGETKSIAVTEDGSFTFANLAPGIFEITVSAPG